MMKTVLIAIAAFSWVTFSPVFADNEQMNTTLVQLINQIDAMMPLIDQAENEQDKQASEQFHFDTFTSADGKAHNGLRQDLLEVKRALIAQINQPALSPRTVAPLQGDYVSPSP
ncbi:MAG: RAQPRD family integrative conjugative element protein [Gammaproteobacteria bacterium]